jgi:arylsulfatase A
MTFRPLFSILLALPLTLAPAATKPNVVLFYMDDMGYADPGCYGGKGYSTPNIDRLAKEGVKFTDFYVSSPVCSASRAALMTGCYHERVSIRGALMPKSKTALALKETTIAEMLRDHGYATGMVGKWHLGDRPEVLPPAQGFGMYFGLPYSNDMWPHNPAAANAAPFPPLPVWDNGKLHNAALDVPGSMELPTEYAKRAVGFIEQNQTKPFFLYFAHNMPHVPLAVHPDRKGKAASGYYGDVMQEIDWTVGQVLETLDRLKLAENTLVIFSSDNGPWLKYGNHAGSAAPLREGKGTCFEGGVRVPCLMRYPGHIPAGSQCQALSGTIDVLPTVAAVTGATTPPVKLDGMNLWPLVQGKEASPGHEAFFFYYAGNQLQAMRSGPWKLHFPHMAACLEGGQAANDGAGGHYQNTKVAQELYNLTEDVGERKNRFSEEPAVVARLTKLANNMRSALGDGLTKQQGSENRDAEILPPLP